MAPVGQVCFIATLPVATRGIAEVKNAPKKYSKGSLAMRVIFVQVNRRHLWVWYPVFIIQPWASWRMNQGWTLYVTFFLCLRSHSHPRLIWPMRRVLTWLLVMRFGSIVVKRHQTKKIQKVNYLIYWSSFVGDLSPLNNRLYHPVFRLRGVSWRSLRKTGLIVKSPSFFEEEELKMILFHKTNPELIWAD